MIRRTGRELYKRLTNWQARQIRWTPQVVKQWEKHRPRGRTPYVIRFGVLGFALPMLVVMVGYRYFRDYGMVWPVGQERELVALVVISVGIWLPVGWLFGSMMWDAMVQSYGERE